MTIEPQWKKQGFKSSLEYLDFLAEQKGFKSHAELVRQKRYEQKTKKMIEKQKKEDSMFWYNVELRKKNACEILKEHHKTIKDDPDSLTTEFLQEQIGILCDKPRKTIKK